MQLYLCNYVTILNKVIRNFKNNVFYYGIYFHNQMKYVIEKEEMSSSESYLQKIQSLQHSLSFLQKEHAETLSGLYKEIAKLQEKCTGKFNA